MARGCGLFGGIGGDSMRRGRWSGRGDVGCSGRLGLLDVGEASLGGALTLLGGDSYL